MANLFSITAPLLIRLPTGDLHVMAERFPHLHGLVYFDLFWHLGNPHLVVHVVEGIIKGDGPWKIGVAVVRVLGCHGTDGALARRVDNGGPISPRPRRTTQRARTSRPSRAAQGATGGGWHCAARSH